MANLESVNSGYLDLPGANIFYEHAGEGETMIFLHGGLLDRRMWDDAFSFFAQNYEVVRFDRRGAGESKVTSADEPNIPYEEIRQVLQVLDLHDVTLVGLSGGARFAIDCSIAYPALVKRLVLVSPGLSGYEFSDPWTAQRASELQQAMSEGKLDEAIEVFLVMWTNGPRRATTALDPEIRERLREMATRSMKQSRDVPIFKELEPPAIGRLATIAVPTLIVLGNQDTTDIQAISSLLEQKIVNAELVIMPDVGHTLVMEQPAQFNAIVARFLERNP